MSLATQEVRFSQSRERVSVCDSRGRWLAINKWNRLGSSFEGDDTGVQERLLESAERLVETLNEYGYPVYIVGGTLLGAMRDGRLMPHDDDIDLAFLCDEKSPIDIGLESMRMQRELEREGYFPVRHSHTHLQVTFFREDGSTDHYIDIFTGFLEEDLDGTPLYSQPFALRGPEVTREDLLPVQNMEIDGHILPAPANPEAWLAYAYGENWRIPDPSFVFETPSSTGRRFNNWFGVFNKKRVYWEKNFEKQSRRRVALKREPSAVKFLGLIPPSSNVVDLGCGDGSVTQQIANAGHRVIGVDYSYEALRLARAESSHDIEYRYVNMNDRRALLEFAVELIKTRKVWYFYMGDSIQGITRADRRNVYLFIREVLRGPAFAFMAFDTNLPEAYTHADPTTWHYPIPSAKREAKRFGLKARVVAEGGTRESEWGTRTRAAVTVRKKKTRIDLRSTREY
ncbi:LicD family protein [Paramicrobacterium fandaimingii]|uniref:LicD family protein n=1 Tax=Paramicrobacterium fandaimingii TaxID=2708079 RepID=UPI001422DE6D|nr:LicD family protein [Microbacterium fandaimingii]